MNKLIPSLLLACCSLPAFAQQELIHPKERTKQTLVQVDTKQPYVLLNDQQTARDAMLISPQSIESIEVLKDLEATSTYGDKAKDGAIIILTKPSVKLARLEDIYAHFNIPKPQQELKVILSNKLIKDTDLILADLTEIERVEVIKQDVTAPVRWSMNEDEKFLNIVPKKQEKL